MVWQLSGSEFPHRLAFESEQAMKLKCKVCGHQWFSRQDKPPLRCPNPHCGSAKWKDGRKVEK
jgi:rubrerythrin